MFSADAIFQHNQKCFLFWKVLQLCDQVVGIIYYLLLSMTFYWFVIVVLIEWVTVTNLSVASFTCYILNTLFIMITYFTLLIVKYKIQRNGTMLSFQKTLRHQLFNIQGYSKSKDSGRAKGLILNKFFSLGLQLYLKRDSCTSIFLWISKNTFLMKYFRATASNHSFYMERFSILLLP